MTHAPFATTADGFLAFDQIDAACVSAALSEELGIAERELEVFLAGPGEPEAAVRFLDRWMRGLDFVVGVAEHMDEMLGTDSWRDCYEAAVVARDRYRSSAYGSIELFRVLSALSEGAKLEGGGVRVLGEALRRLRKSGASLPADRRSRVAALDAELVAETLRFTRAADESQDAFAILVDDESALHGLPEWAIEHARSAAARHGQIGYRLGLEIAVVNAVLERAHDRDLRRRLYLGHVTRATGRASEGDNRPVLERILALRCERAKLLGYATFSDLALDGQMLDSREAVSGFLAELTAALRPSFERETASLLRLATEHGVSEVEPWDVAYFAEIQRRRECDFDKESTRPYFPYHRVLATAQELTSELFAVRWESVIAPTWHPSVTVWRVRSGDELVATVYVDPFARAGKREGAWMSPLVSSVPQRGPGVVVLAADVAAPSSDSDLPCLSIEEVSRLLHELGHVMHHVLSKTNYATLSGTRVPRDFVELPSTLLEKMSWESAVLSRMAGHVTTGASIPEPLLNRCLAARDFRAASALMQRVGLCVVDLLLHANERLDGADAMRLAASTMQQHSPATLPSSYARIAVLTHVFGSTEGYESLLYSYVWAEVLAADAMSRLGAAWEGYAAGGAALRDEVLAKGNEIPPGILVERFLGRAPSTRALLELLGVASEAKTRPLDDGKAIS